MKTLTLLAVWTTLGLAAEPPPAAKPAAQVLILANDGTLVGQVDAVEGGYRLRSDRGESVFAAKQVLRVCGSLREAFFFLQGRANLRDPHERLRLARWCFSQNLLTEARLECEAALALAPKAEAAKQLLRQIDGASAASLPAIAKPASPTTPPGLTSGLDAQVELARLAATSHAAPSGSENPLEGWERALSKPALREFTQHVQPILINGCGTGACHGGDQAKGGFLLHKPPTIQGITPQHTRHNLSQAVRLLDRKAPADSLLLKKALEPHGGSDRVPLGGQDQPAFRALEQWVRQVAPPPVVAASTFTPRDDGQVTQAQAFAGGRAEEPPPSAVLPVDAKPEEMTKDEALRQLLERRTATGGAPKPYDPKAPPLPSADDLQKASQDSREGLQQSGTPAMLGGGHVVGRAATPDEPRLAPKAQAAPAATPPAIMEGKSGDPYDPAPFNEWAKKRR